ncbi:hypothetical protein ACWDTG_02020 [Rhodococcus zopfii]|uniref:hypothetical protein n=1 Tax=Rhodococcus zopfii TaxID=43772 RepID=UPI0011111CF1|nr:hypothetical protein [Rhodococcus zopfii]
MRSGRVKSALIGAIAVAIVFIATAPAHAATESPSADSQGSSVIGLRELFDWAFAFVLSAFGIV